MDVFLTSDGLLALMTLAALEIVLGVDNLAARSQRQLRLTDSFDGTGRRILTFIGYARGGP
jgi:hypothetical protein